jgi:hypothetical protein
MATMTIVKCLNFKRSLGSANECEMESIRAVAARGGRATTLLICSLFSSGVPATLDGSLLALLLGIALPGITAALFVFPRAADSRSLKQKGHGSMPWLKVDRPLEELKGFTRVHIAAGSSQHLTIPLAASSLRYWDEARDTFELEPDRVELRVASSSQDIRLRRIIVVQR